MEKEESQKSPSDGVEENKENKDPNKTSKNEECEV